MSYAIKRTNTEIDNLLNSAAQWEERGGSAVPGMTYEQGVAYGIRWLVGDIQGHPIEEDPPDE